MKQKTLLIYTYIWLKLTSEMGFSLGFALSLRHCHGTSLISMNFMNLSILNHYMIEKYITVLHLKHTAYNSHQLKHKSLS